MTPAQELTGSLGGKWLGTYGLARCPAHDDHRPSLSIRDGDRRVLFHCFAGCVPRDIVAELRRRGLFDKSSRAPEHSRQAPTPAAHSSNTAAALRTWLAARRINGTLGEQYLRRRGIEIALPPTLRFHPGLRHSPTGIVMPAMVGGVQDADGKVIAIHRTWLDGNAKADIEPPKMALGPLGVGAIRLAPACGHFHFIGIAEGLESALSVMQIWPGFPVWASLGGERLSRLWLPPEIGCVVIFADRDTLGLRAAEKAKVAYEATGRLCEIVLPESGVDFNDALRAKATAA